MASGLENIETIESPFRRFVTTIGIFPTAFTDAMTYYECLAYLVKYLEETVIPAVNENAEALKELQTLYIQLKSYVDNYFANLDVQEEINNKLDAMAEAGTLQEIITAYIQSNVAWTFDNVAEMQSATNLVNGSYAQTLGYYSIDDGGKSLYYITDSGTADGGKVIALAGGLFAHLVVKDEVFVEQFGAKGDGTTDDQDAINLAMQSGADVVKFVGGKTYMVKGYETGQSEGSTPQILSSITGIVIPSNKIVDLNYAKVKIIANERQNYNIFTLENIDNVILKNGYIEGDVSTHTGASGEWGYGVSLRIAKNVVLDNLHITKCWGDGINLNNDGEAGDFNENVIINNCICDDNRRQGMSIENANHLIVEDSKFINTGTTAHTNPTAGVDVEPAYDTAKNITFTNCEFNNNYNAGLIIDGDNIDNVIVDCCTFNNNISTGSGSIFFVNGASKVKVINTNFINTLETYKIVLLNAKDGIIVDNCNFYDAHIHLSGSKSTKAVHYVTNNKFYVNITSAWNSIIELAGSSSTNKNELMLEGNLFENINANKEMNISNYIDAVANKGFVKISVIGNIFKYGRRTMTLSLPAVIKGNEIIGCYYAPIYINASGTSLDNQVSVIESNIFELTNYRMDSSYIIYVQTGFPLVLLNNTYFTKTLNSGDLEDISYTPTSWYNTTPSNLTEANNNIVSLS